MKVRRNVARGMEVVININLGRRPVRPNLKVIYSYLHKCVKTRFCALFVLDRECDYSHATGPDSGRAVVSYHAANSDP